MSGGEIVFAVICAWMVFDLFVAGPKKKRERDAWWDAYLEDASAKNGGAGKCSHGIFYWDCTSCAMDKKEGGA